MKLYKILCFSSLLITLVSCTFNENVVINDNGTGKFSVEMDGSQFMQMANDQFGSQMGPDMKNDIDSTFTFKQLLEDKKDSIAKLSPEDQNKIKRLENFVVNTKMNAQNKQFLLTISSDFKDVNELEDILQSASKLQKLEKQSASSPLSAFGDNFGNNNSKLSYTYNGKKFIRKATIEQEKLPKKVDDTIADMSKMFFASSTYKLNYHFPKRIKKVSNPDALYSEDRKSVTVQYPFTDYMENPQKFDLIIEFEKK